MIEVKNLTKAYRPKKGEPVQALKGINLQFEDKGLVFILGKSGSGKSTLLNMLGGLDQFDEGEIVIKGKSSKEFVQADFDSYRNTFIGFIFQEYNILNDFTVGANIALAMELQGKKAENKTLDAILKEVDLEGFGDRKPNELSGGQKQRVAIARALIKNPEIIMADEPTGALDSNTGKQVFDTLKRLSKDKLVIVVSHDREFAEQYGDRVIEMKDGNVISDIKKCVSKSSDINQGIQIINESIIHIKPGYELTAEDMAMINSYLKKNKENETFISLDSRTNDKIRQAAQIDEIGNQQAFEAVTDQNLAITQYDGEKLNLIKSKLPFKSSFKMAAGSLKKKPFRLAMTVLLSTVSFSLFGLANTMSSYDKIKAATDSIIDTNIDYMALVKETEVTSGEWSYYTNDRMTEEDVAEIQKKFPEESLSIVSTVGDGTIFFEQNIANGSKLNPYGEFAYYPAEFAGATAITEQQLDNLGYTLTGKLPEKDEEIVITKVAAESFIVGGYIEPGREETTITIASAEDMIGKKLTLSINSNENYIITGIIDTKFDGSRYEMFKKESDPTVSGISVYMLQGEMTQVLSKSYHNLLYTTEKVWNQIVSSNEGIKAYGDSYDVMLVDEERGYAFDSILELSKLSEEAKENVMFFDAAKTKLEPNEILLPNSIIEQINTFSAMFVDTASLEEMKQAVRNNKEQLEALKLQLSIEHMENDWSTVLTDMKVVGVYLDVNGMNSGKAILEDGFCERNGLTRSGKYSTVLGKMPENRSDIQEIVAYSIDNGVDGVKYSLRNATSSLLNNVNDLVDTARNVLLGVGIGFAVFAALMLMNFITTSISYRKREIGILRAVGARGRDVFVIFFKESTMIALMNWVCAMGATAIVVSRLNNMFRTDYNLVITVFHFGVLQMILMLGLSVVVAFVASFFPVYKVSKKKPIEVIRKN